MSLSACGNSAEKALSDEQDTPGISQETDSSEIEIEPVGAAALIKSVQSTGISSGEIRMTGTTTTIDGDVLEQYEDDNYTYTISFDKTYILTGLYKNLDGIENGSMTESEMTEHGNALAQKLYPYMDWASGGTTITSSPSGIYIEADESTGIDTEVVYQMTFQVEERVGNVLLSTNMFDFNSDGIVILFTRLQNDISRFNLDSHISAEEARQIAFIEAMRHKEEWEGIIGGTLAGETIDDFVFGRVEQYIPDNKNVAWSVEIKPKTSWGSMNEIEDYMLKISVDAVSGEILVRDIRENSI